MHTKKDPVRDAAFTRIFDYYRLPRAEKIKQEFTKYLAKRGLNTCKVNKLH